jgi:hypothetical protein
MLVGKTTIRMNSEPLLGRQSPKQKHSLSPSENPSANGPGLPPGSGATPKTGLIPRRDFGPAAGNSQRAPMLKFSRGSWLSKPTEENPTDKPGVVVIKLFLRFRGSVGSEESY